jgi:hypothetical protein
MINGKQLKLEITIEKYLITRNRLNKNKIRTTL